MLDLIDAAAYLINEWEDGRDSAEPVRKREEERDERPKPNMQSAPTSGRRRWKVADTADMGFMDRPGLVVAEKENGEEAGEAIEPVRGEGGFIACCEIRH